MRKNGSERGGEEEEEMEVDMGGPETHTEHVCIVMVALYVLSFLLHYKP